MAKYSDHLLLYRQERIFGRAGVELPRSTLAQWVGICGVRLQPLVDALRCEILKHSVVHADETPVAMLKPGNGKTHRAYPLMTNDRSLTPAQVLQAHKGQPMIEKRFEQVKTVHEIAPVFLKDEARIEALFTSWPCSFKP